MSSFLDVCNRPTFFISVFFSILICCSLQHFKAMYVELVIEMLSWQMMSRNENNTRLFGIPEQNSLGHLWFVFPRIPAFYWRMFHHLTWYWSDAVSFLPQNQCHFRKRKWKSIQSDVISFSSKLSGRKRAQAPVIWHLIWRTKVFSEACSSLHCMVSVSRQI